MTRIGWQAEPLLVRIPQGKLPALAQAFRQAAAQSSAAEDPLQAALKLRYDDGSSSGSQAAPGQQASATAPALRACVTAGPASQLCGLGRKQVKMHVACAASCIGTVQPQSDCAASQRERERERERESRPPMLCSSSCVQRMWADLASNY